jgi:hypothetical protein
MVRLNVQGLSGKQLAIVAANLTGYSWEWLECNQEHPEMYNVNLNDLRFFIESKQVSICPVDDTLIPGRWIAYLPGDVYFWGECPLEALQKCYCANFTNTAYLEVPDWVADL